MTVNELIARLSTFPVDAPVVAEWEGTLNTLSTQDVICERSRAGLPVVILLVDGNNSDRGGTRIYDSDEAL